MTETGDAHTLKAESSPTAAVRGRRDSGHAHSMGGSPSMAQDMERGMKHRFLVALVLTIPVAALAGHIPGLPVLLHPPLSNWVGLVLSTPVVWWCGWIFISGSASH
jgi:cation transport ATPase